MYTGAQSSLFLKFKCDMKETSTINSRTNSMYTRAKKCAINNK